MFLYYTHHDMNFHSCEKQIYESFGCTKIRKDPKWTKTSRNKVTQPTITTNNSQTIFPDYVHSQADFDNPFINGRGFIYLGISKMSFIFEGFTRVQGSVSIKTASKAKIEYTPSIVGNWKSLLKVFEFKCL